MDAKSNMDKACEQHENFEENGNQKDTYNYKETVEIYGIHNHEEGLENLILRGQIKGKRETGKNA